MSTIGTAVRHAREQAELTQAALAERVDLKQSTLSDIERGRSAPSLDTVGRLEHALGMQAGALLRLTGAVDDGEGIDVPALVEHVRAAAEHLTLAAKALGVTVSPTAAPAPRGRRRAASR